MSLSTWEWLATLPPWAWYFAAAALVPVLPRSLRVAPLVIAPLLGVATFATGAVAPFSLLGLELVPYRVDALSYPFLLLFNLAALLGAVYALNVRDPLQHAAALLYAGSALGAVGAGDWVSLFTFWELMALASFALVCATRTRAGLAAGLRYLLIHVSSGLLLLVGALLHLQQSGSILLDGAALHGAAGWLLLAAAGIKCAFPPLHNWLTDAYPAATPSATVFLSVFTTKAAVYLLARAFPGTEVLIYIGAFMACFPLFLAMLENDLRRVLCYSMVSQLGFMVCGVGVGNALALDGVVAHAYNDVLFKGLLFMAVGAVLHVTGTARASELGGLRRHMPQTAWLCIIGAAAISALPPFGGFVSKSMIMGAVLKEAHGGAWLALLFAAAAAPVYVGIRIPWLAFYARPAAPRTATEAPLNMRAAMCLAALLCLAAGCFPGALQQLLPHGVRYSPYDLSHVLAQLQLLAFSALAVAWMIRTGRYPAGARATVLDAEWAYRRLLPLAMNAGTGLLAGVARRLTALGQRCSGYILSRLETWLRPGGVPGRLLDSGAGVWLAMGVLVGCLLLYYAARPG